MNTYTLFFQPDADSIPEMECTVLEPSDEMAYNYAAKLLQSSANTMFHTVKVYNNRTETVQVCELRETRGTAKVDTYTAGER